jgi:hypothetical protein
MANGRVKTKNKIIVLKSNEITVLLKVLAYNANEK